MSEMNRNDMLLQHCHRGKIMEVRSALEKDVVDINYRNENGGTALHAAAATGQLEVVQLLLEQEALNVSGVDDADQTALYYAAFHGHLEVVQVLVEHGVSLELPDKLGRLVHNAGAINGHLDVVTYLLEECKDPININAIDEYGGTCLHWAALKGRKEVVQYLCRKGIDVHLTSYDNRTALQLAKDKHKQRCVQFLKSWMELLQQLLTSSEEGNDTEIKRIINEVNGAYPLRYLKDKDGKNALHWAASAGKLESMKLLAEQFDVLTDVDKYGRNALHWAALGGHRSCVMWLISKSIGTSLIHSLTLTNKSPSRCAFEAGHSALASKLQAVEEGHDEVFPDVATDESSASATKQGTTGGIREEEHTVTSGRDIDTVSEWLKVLKLDEYAENFSRDGFDTLRGVATITENDLADMGVKKGHGRDVMAAISDLKQQLAILDSKSKLAGKEPERAPTLSMLPSLNDELCQTNPPSIPATLARSGSLPN